MLRFFERFFHNYQVCQTMRALDKLSDAQLKDIGIRRDQIGEYASSKFQFDRV